MAASELNDDDESLPSTDVEGPVAAEGSRSPSRITITSENSLYNYGTFEANNSPEPLIGTPRHVTYWSGVSLVVGNQIGGGFFGSPAIVNGNAGSMGMSLTVWFIAGCLAWSGAGKYCSFRSSESDSSIVCRTRICNTLQRWREGIFKSYFRSNFRFPVFLDFNHSIEACRTWPYLSHIR